VAEREQNASGNDNTQIGGDGVIAGGDITHITHGVDPKEYAELLAQNMLLIESMEARNRENGSADFSLINKRVVVLTGAGISAESGISTFDGTDEGRWEGYEKNKLATPDAWKENPELVWRYYQERRRQLLTVRPNPAHQAIFELSSKVEKFTLITQNVDDLHERSGSDDVIHMHGKLRTLRCENSGKKEERMQKQDLLVGFSLCNCCSPPEKLRPDIVWFGEDIHHGSSIQSALQSCDVFIVVGTSGTVYPAADYVNTVQKMGGRAILVNLGLPDNIERFQEIHLGEAGKILPDLVKNWT
jgi:NAD-dependent deacetylase